MGWNSLDIILITGDTYIDSPSSGIAVIGKVLVDAGFMAGIIAQPDTKSPKDITRLGEPKLFWGITGGCMDSLVANYTATGKFRKSDDLTPGGINNCRPVRASIVYANLIRQYFKNTVPLVLGGIESSLRRITHYDYWSNRVRNSILFDAKGDILIYGMGEKTVCLLADHLRQGKDYKKIRGLCYISKNPISGYTILPPANRVKQDPSIFLNMFALFYKHSLHPGMPGMIQQHGDRYLVHNPPQSVLTTKDLDHIYSLPYEYDAHPYYKKMGSIRALDTIRFSITSHRGCCGECSFCAISLHQGRAVNSRSESSIIKEIRQLSEKQGFKGYISDIGGATANMYKIGCKIQQFTGMCTNKSCLFPSVCPNLRLPHKPILSLLQKIRSLPGIKKAFIASGIRHDLVLADTEYGKIYLREILTHHTSGQMKIAPEHTNDFICRLMKKSGQDTLLRFKKMFDKEQSGLSSTQFLTYYFMAAHPGCTLKDMKVAGSFIRRNLKICPEQLQIFTPVPSTWSTAMYYTGIDPLTGKKIFVEKDKKKKQAQKDVILRKIQ